MFQPEGTYGLVDLSRHEFVARGLGWPLLYVHISGDHFVLVEGTQHHVVRREVATSTGYMCSCAGAAGACLHCQGMAALESAWVKE